VQSGVVETAVGMGPHATESAPSSAPSLGVAPARELGSASCPVAVDQLRRPELGAIPQHGMHDDREPAREGTP
jgi:hypothetical protein